MNIYYGIIYPVKLREVISAICAQSTDWKPLATTAGTLKVGGRSEYEMFLRENALNPANATKCFIVVDGMSIGGEPESAPESVMTPFDLDEFKDATNKTAQTKLGKLYDFLVDEVTKRGVDPEPICLGWFAANVEYVTEPIVVATKLPRSVKKKTSG